MYKIKHKARYFYLSFIIMITSVSTASAETISLWDMIIATPKIQSILSMSFYDLIYYLLISFYDLIYYLFFEHFVFMQKKHVLILSIMLTGASVADIAIKRYKSKTDSIYDIKSFSNSIEIIGSLIGLYAGIYSFGIYFQSPLTIDMGSYYNSFFVTRQDVTR